MMPVSALNVYGQETMPFYRMSKFHSSDTGNGMKNGIGQQNHSDRDSDDSTGLPGSGRRLDDGQPEAGNDC